MRGISGLFNRSNSVSQAEQEKAQFLEQYRARQAKVTDFPNLDAATAAFEAALAARSSAFLSGQTEKHEKLIANARAAITNANPLELYFALGPDFYTQERRFLETTRSNYAEYLSELLKFTVARRREVVMLKFAQEQAYPEKLTPSQQTELKERFFDAFEPARIQNGLDYELPDNWKIQEELYPEDVWLGKMANLLWSESEKAKTGKPVVNLRAALIEAKDSIRDSIARIQTLQSQQEMSLQAYTKLREDDCAVSWAAFRERCAKFSEPEARARELKEINLDAAPLARLEQGASLLDFALLRYAACPDGDKQKPALFQILEILLRHGSQLSSLLPNLKLDWSVLRLILTCMIPQTPWTFLIKDKILDYVQKSEQQASSALWKATHNSDRKEERRQFIQALVWCMYEGTIFDVQIDGQSNREKKLFSMISQMKEDLGRSLSFANSSDLHSILSLIEKAVPYSVRSEKSDGRRSYWDREVYRYLDALNSETARVERDIDKGIGRFFLAFEKIKTQLKKQDPGKNIFTLVMDELGEEFTVFCALHFAQKDKKDVIPAHFCLIDHAKIFVERYFPPEEFEDSQPAAEPVPQENPKSSPALANPAPLPVKDNPEIHAVVDSVLAPESRPQTEKALIVFEGYHPNYELSFSNYPLHILRQSAVIVFLALLLESFLPYLSEKGSSYLPGHMS